MKKKIVYLAHPVSKDVSGNLKKLEGIYRQLSLENEVIPFIPYYATLMSLQDSEPAEREIGFSHNEAIFRRGLVDEVWLYGDFISRGMEIEIGWANELGIDVVSKSDGTILW